MKTTDAIRQHQPGQFRRTEDGSKPYAHVNGKKLLSKEDQKKSAFYVNNKNVVTLKKGTGSRFPKLFDSDAGLKVSTEKLSKVKKEEKGYPQYDKTGKTQVIKTKDERRIDQWA